MKENNTTISFLDFEEDVNARYENEIIVDWLGRDIVIKKNLALYEVLNFVDDVVDNCYQGDEVKTFMPELKDYAIKFCMITFYTNIILMNNLDGESTNSENSFTPDIFITRSGIIDVIKQHIDTRQFDEIVLAIESKIEYINQTYVAGVMSDISKVNNIIEEALPVIEAFSTDESRDKLNELMDIISTFNNDNTIQQLAIQQVKNERRSELGQH